MASKLREAMDTVNKSLSDQSKPWSTVFGKAEQLIGLDRVYIFLIGVAFVALWLVFGYAAQLVCNIVGFAYPAYVSIHAIETTGKDDDKKWLTYWVVFAVFSLIEFFTDIITGWVPLYWLVKCIFMVWLMIPTDFNGSIIIYNRVIRPHFLKHHGTIDDALTKAKTEASKIFNKEQ